MILADKIIKHRKQNGWSQEELAEKMNVSRQAVSKWEGAQTVPDLEKLLQLSHLFGVTTDYLLKDEIEEADPAETPSATVRRVTLSEAQAYLAWRDKAARRIAVATLLCILSPLPLILLSALSRSPAYGIPEIAAAGIGLGVLFVTVAIAVLLYLTCGFENRPYAFLDEEPFETEYGVTGMVKEKQKAYQSTYGIGNILGTLLCILSPLPLILGSISEGGLLTVLMLCIMLIMVAIGVYLFVTVGVRHAAMQRILKEGEFAPKQKNKLTEVISTAYWLIVTAVFLGWSMVSDDWQITWVVWPIAAILYGAVMALCRAFFHKDT